ncbi:MAG: hypothetical protein KF684_06250 [Phycisphaeraceae bacterium]|nr:hypothetical protein [Phycisphaeraceae bacterium]
MQIASNDTTIAALGAAARPDPAATKRKLAAIEELSFKEKAGAQPRPTDTVELTEVKPAAPSAQVTRSAAQEVVADQTPATPTPAAPSTPDDLVASVLKSIGARAGEDGYNAALDVNGDGVINFADLNAAISGAGAPPQTGGPSPIESPAGAPTAQGLGADASDDIAPTNSDAIGAPVPSTPAPSNDEPRVYTADDIELALGAFGAVDGDDAFDTDFDFDGDGRISFGDLNELLSRLGGQTAQQSLISQLTELFGATSNDTRFNPSIDFDGDGVINFTDLNTLLSRLAENNASQG